MKARVPVAYGCCCWKGEFGRDSNARDFGYVSATYDACPEGRLFDRYPNNFSIAEFSNTKRSKIRGSVDKLLTILFPNRGSLDQGLHINGIEAYCHKSWREHGANVARDPTSCRSDRLDEVSRDDYAAYRDRNTGRHHQAGRSRSLRMSLLENTNGRGEKSRTHS